MRRRQSYPLDRIRAIRNIFLPKNAYMPSCQHSDVNIDINMNPAATMCQRCSKVDFLSPFVGLFKLHTSTTFNLPHLTLVKKATLRVLYGESVLVGMRFIINVSSAWLQMTSYENYKNAVRYDHVGTQHLQTVSVKVLVAVFGEEKVVLVHSYCTVFMRRLTVWKMKAKVPQIRTALLKRSSRYCENKTRTKRTRQKKGYTPFIWFKSYYRWFGSFKTDQTAPSYLISAGKMQSVQHGNENVGRNEQTEEVGTADEPVLSAVSVDFRRHADNRHRRLEWGEERQRNGKTAHAAVRQQELLRGALTPPRKSVVQPDADGGGEQERKYHIVCGREVLLVGRVHADGLWASAAEGLVLLQTAGESLCPHPSVRRVSEPWRITNTGSTISLCVRG